MSAKSSLLRRVSSVMMGGVVALTGYILVIEPYLSKSSMGKIEDEARQIYMQRKARLAKEMEETGSAADSATEFKQN